MAPVAAGNVSPTPPVSPAPPSSWSSDPRRRLVAAVLSSPHHPVHSTTAVSPTSSSLLLHCPVWPPTTSPDPLHDSARNPNSGSEFSINDGKHHRPFSPPATTSPPWLDILFPSPIWKGSRTPPCAFDADRAAAATSTGALSLFIYTLLPDLPDLRTTATDGSFLLWPPPAGKCFISWLITSIAYLLSTPWLCLPCTVVEPEPCLLLSRILRHPGAVDLPIICWNCNCHGVLSLLHSRVRW